MFLVTAHARSEVIRAPLSFLCEAASGEELDWSERRPPKTLGSRRPQRMRRQAAGILPVPSKLIFRMPQKRRESGLSECPRGVLTSQSALGGGFRPKGGICLPSVTRRRRRRGPLKGYNFGLGFGD